MQNYRGLVITLIVLVLIVVLVPALGGGMMGWGWGPGMMGRWYGGQPGWPWGLAMGFGALVMLAFWAAVIVGIVLLVRSVGGLGGTTAPRGDTPQDILKRRLAAGEITPEEYERMRQVLERP